MTKLFDAFPSELKKEVSKSNSRRGTRKTKKVNKSKKIPTNKSRPADSYAFEVAKKLPLDDERQVKSAMEHLLDVKRATDDDRLSAYKKILKYAESYGICTMGFNSKFEQYLSNRVLGE